MSDRATVSRIWFRVAAYAAGAAFLLFAAHLMLTAWTARSAARAVASMERRIGPLDPRTLSPPEVPERDNRAPLLTDAAARLDLTREDGQLLYDVSMRTHDRGTESLDRLRTIVGRNEDALALVRAAAERPASNWGIDYEYAISAEIPDLKSLVSLSRLARAEAEVNIREGRPAEASQATARVFVVSGSLANEPILMVQLLRVGMDHAGHGAVMELLERFGSPSGQPHSLQEEDLSHLQAAVAAARGPDPFVSGLTGEIKAIHEAVSGAIVVSDGVHSNNSAGVIGKAGAFLVKPMMHANHKEYLEAMAAVLEAQAVPAHERIGAAWEDENVADVPWYAAGAQIAIPNLGDAVLRRDLMDARHALTMTALALRRHRLAIGRYPDRLDELVPKFLESLPVDPFSGGPPEYRRDGAGFSLGSAGATNQTRRRPVPDEFLEWRIPS